MKGFGNPLISISAPLLVVLAIFGFFHRDGRDRVQSIPAFIVGSGLILTGTIRRFRRRRMFLREIQKGIED